MTILSEMKVCAAEDCSNEFIPNTINQRYCNPQCKQSVKNNRRRKKLVYNINSAVNSLYYEEEMQIEYLRKEVTRLERENIKLRCVKDEHIAALYRGMKEGLAQIDFKPIPAPQKTASSKDEEVAVIMVSDLQLAKLTPSYNTDICEQRMELYADKVIRLTNIQRADHPVRTAKVWFLGDLLEGVGIFPGIHWHVDNGLYQQMVVHGPRILGNFLRRLLSEFETIEVVCVDGNHGRPGTRAKEEFGPEFNSDRILANLLDHIFAGEPRIKFTMREEKNERSWYYIDHIGAYSSLLLHGEQFVSINSMNLMARRIFGWAAGALETSFQDIALGHFHQAAKMTFGKITLRINGTTESSNNWAVEKLAVSGQPSQHLMFVHPKKGIVTAEYDVLLNEV